MARASEDELIARYFAPLAGPAGLGLADDAACLAPRPGRDLVLTVDTSVAGVHFPAADAPEAIGFRALAVNLSDLAAKGADPEGFLLSLALPEGWTEEWLAGFARGLGGLASRSGCALLGGDTVRSGGPLAVSITALGSVPSGAMVRRTTAAPGDILCVTGTIGDATLGLDLALGRAPGEEGGWASGLDPEARLFLSGRYRTPEPRTRFASLLRSHARAAMDVSDGLAGDLAKMLRASGVGGVLDLDRVPLSRAARAALACDGALLPRLVGGGDDYEILFAAAPDAVPLLVTGGAEIDLPVTPIGRVRTAPGLDILHRGREIAIGAGSFQHF